MNSNNNNNNKNNNNKNNNNKNNNKNNNNKNNNNKNNKNTFTCPKCNSNKNILKLTSKSGFSDISKSPDLEWNKIEDAQSYALLCIDPDAPMGNYRHWVLLNIPADLTSLPASESILTQKWEVEGHTIIQGKNQIGEYGYIPPSPPSGTHRYYFCLYALDTKLTNNNNNNKNITNKIEDHVIACGHYMQKYSANN